MNAKGIGSIPSLHTQSLGSKIRDALDRPTHLKSKQNLSGDSSATESHRAAAHARKVALEQIDEAHREVEKVRSESDHQMDVLRDDHSKQVEEEQAQQEQDYLKLRMEGQKKLHDLAQTIQKEQQMIKDMGEKRTRQLSDYYDDQLLSVDNEGQRDLNDSRRQQMMLMEREEMQADHSIKNLQLNNERRLEAMKNQNDMQFTELSQASQKKIEEDRMNFSAQSKRAEDFFSSNFTRSLQEHMQRMNRMNNDARKALQELKEDYTTSLSSYTERAEDPFYRSIDIGANLEEDGEEFVLTANIPFHEQDGIGVAISGDQLILTGRRHFKETTDLDSGSKRTTSAFQSYTQSYPLSYPVETRSLSKEFQGDQLVVKVMKKPLSYQPYQAARVDVEPVRAQRPKFPDEILADKAKRESQTPQNPEKESPELVKASHDSIPLDAGDIELS